MGNNPPPLQLSTDFIKRIQGAFGGDGAAWINNLPQILESISERWSLRLEPHFPSLSYNFVAPGITSEGREVVLKLGVPNKELNGEILALNAFNGNGMVRLFESDASMGALLLERIRPGTSLIDLEDDQEATSIACGLIRQWQSSDAAVLNLQRVEEWGAGFARHRVSNAGGAAPIPETHLLRAETLFAELCTSAKEHTLLHADLHHLNILSAGRQPWLAIDPKGVLGDPAYETGVWLRNPVAAIRTGRINKELLSRRVDQFEDELAFERTRILDWAYCQAVLSACWALEDKDEDWELTIDWAELFLALS